jgi:hypothetical protein
MHPKDETTPPITEPNEGDGKRAEEAARREEAEALERAEEEARQRANDVEFDKDIPDDFSDIGETD